MWCIYTENNYRPVEGICGGFESMDEKALDALRNGLEDSYWYGDDDEKVFNELVRKAKAFDRLYAEFHRGDKDLSKADFDEVYKEDK